MKLRNSFVANSSSTSFIITNKTNEVKTLKEFAEENIDLLYDFNHEYDCNYSKKGFLDSIDNSILEPGENSMAFGDEEGTIIGRVYDYILREDGESENFKWKYHESLR